MKDYLRDFAERDRLGRLLGVELAVTDDGGWEGRLRVRDEHLNGLGTAHGGTVFTLADIVFAAAVNSGGRVAVAVNTALTFYRATRAGELLRARARELAASRRLVHVAVDVLTEDGTPVALFQGTAYIKNPAG